MTPVEQITSLYVGYFGRAPEPAGLNYWVGRLADGFSLAEIAESFSVQAESTTKYPFLANPNIASPEAFITQVYLNLFNRVPDAAGLAYWTAELANGADVGDFILNVVSGAQGDDKVIIDNKIEVGADFAVAASNQPGFVYNTAAANAAAGVIDGVDATDASVVEGKAETGAFISGSGNTGEPISLTPVVGETIVGTNGNDRISGTVDNNPINGNTFASGDNIDGGNGDDTLLITATAGGNIFANLTSVETIDVRAFAGLNIDLGTSTGVETVSRTGGDNNVGFTNVGNLVDIELNNITDGSGVFVTYDNAVVVGTSTAQNVALDSAETFVTVAGIETLNVSATGADSLSETNTLFTDVAGLTTLNVSGDGDLVVNNLAGTVKTINAAASSGDVTVTVNGLLAVSATGGAGDDTFNFQASLGAGDVVNGGAGVDTVSVTSAGNYELPANAAALAALNALASVERITFNTNGTQINGATFTNTGVSILNFTTAGDDIINNAGSARTYEFGAGNGGDATFNMNGTSTTVNIDLVGTDTLVNVANEGVAASVSNLAVVLSGVQPAGTLATINLSSLGDLQPNLNNFVGNIDAVGGSTVIVDGTESLRIDLVEHSVTINATALTTGSLFVEGSNFTGTSGVVGVSATVSDAETSGVDTIQLAANTLTDRIEFSTAADSGEIVVGSGAFAATGAVLHDVISGFAVGTSGDVLDFLGNGAVDTYTAISSASQAAINALAGSAATVLAAADLAANANNTVGWTSFNFQGSTYAVYESGAADTVGGYTNADLLVELTGISAADLTSANFA